MSVLLLFLASAIEPVRIAESAVSVVPLDSVTVLLFDEDGTGRTLDVTTGISGPWSPSWQPADDGWIEDGYTFILDRSPDGRFILMVRGVYVPDQLPMPEGMEGMRGAVLAMVCRRDGSDARPLAVSILVGGGPDFAITSDSRFLIGTPLFACEPTPEGYTASIGPNGDEDGIGMVNRVNLATGDREFDETLELSDGFWKCPYSDWARLENNWYAEHTFSNLATGGVAGFYRVPEGEASVQGWVREDALLMTTCSGQGLLHVDGSFVPSASPDIWDIVSWLPDGRFIYSTDEGKNLRLGRVDWDTFSPDAGAVPVEIPEDLLLYAAIPMPGRLCTGVLFHDRWGDGSLWFLPTAGLTESGAGGNEP